MTSLVLLCPHTHAGKPFEADERLIVDAGTADWLIANGIARADRQPDVPPQTQSQPDADGKTADAKPIQRKESKS
jgi:hypothetical protein